MWGRTSETENCRSELFRIHAGTHAEVEIEEAYVKNVMLINICIKFPQPRKSKQNSFSRLTTHLLPTFITIILGLKMKIKLRSGTYGDYNDR